MHVVPPLRPRRPDARRRPGGRGRPGPAPWLAALILLGGCGGLGGLVGGTDAAATPALSYGVPAENPVDYTFADTARFAIDTGPMGTMRVVGAQEGRAELTFREDDGRLLVDVRFPRLDASFESMTQGAERVDESHVSGPFGVTLAPGGGLTVVDTPAVTPELGDMIGPETLLRPLFVHLPGRPVETGATWTDTVRTLEETRTTRSTGQSIVTTTLVGDTLVDGRRLLLLRTRAENRVEVVGTAGAVDAQQLLRGTTVGRVLWDPERRLLVERHEEGELSGTLTLPGFDVDGLPVTGAVRRTVRLSPGPGARS